MSDIKGSINSVVIGNCDTVCSRGMTIRNEPVMKRNLEIGSIQMAVTPAAPSALPVPGFLPEDFQRPAGPVLHRIPSHSNS